MIFNSKQKFTGRFGYLVNDVVNTAVVGFTVVPDQHILPSFTPQKSKNVTALTPNLGGVRPMSDVRAGCCYLLNKI